MAKYKEPYGENTEGWYLLLGTAYLLQIIMEFVNIIQMSALIKINSKKSN